MFDHYTYLLSIILFAGLAILVEWFFNFNLLKKHARAIIKTTVILASYFFVVEFLFFHLLNAGYFNEEMVLGVYLGRLPAEEILFWLATIFAMGSATVIFSQAEERNLNLFETIIFFFSPKK